MSTPESDMARRRALLDTIKNLTERIVECDYSRTLLIKAARQEVCTWHEIADVLGVSPQAAWKKYSPQNPEKIMPGQDTLPIEYDE